MKGSRHWLTPKEMKSRYVRMILKKGMSSLLRSSLSLTQSPKRCVLRNKFKIDVAIPYIFSKFEPVALFFVLKCFIQIEWEMRRKNRKQKKVVVQAGKSKTGFEAEDEEEDVSIMLIFIKHSLMRMSFIRLPLVVE